MVRHVRTIDAHAAGQPLRLVVDGFPRPSGSTMQDKRAWLKKRADTVRRALMLEPRGHADMCGALLTEPVTPGADAGVLYMHNSGYSTMSGHGTIALTTIGVERGLLTPKGDELLLDSPAGLIRARPRRTADEGVNVVRVSSVAFTNVPSFVYEPGVAVKLGGRTVRADVAFSGAFYAIVDAEAAGVPVDGAHLPELRRLGMEVKRAVEAARTIVHPVDPSLCGVYGTIFTGPPHSSSADLRNVTIFADGQVNRSPSGTGIAALLSVLDAMSLAPGDRSFTSESVIGTVFQARVIGRTAIGDYNAIVPEIEGSAWITGEHQFIIDDDDPLREGFGLTSPKA